MEDGRSISKLFHCALIMNKNFFNYTPPADKSIFQRALIISSLISGESEINNISFCDDSISLMKAIRRAGIEMKILRNKIFIKGGHNNFKEGNLTFSCKESATAMRLLSGALLGLGREKIILKAEGTLKSRDMSQLVLALRKIGILIKASFNNHPPLIIEKSNIKNFKIEIKKPSAQIKSAILLAALSLRKEISVKEKYKTRDHTERMLRLFGADIRHEKGYIKLRPGILKPAKISVPGDFSCAAFFLAAAAMIKNSQIKVNDTGLNPSRIGFLNVLRKMGADIKIKYKDMAGYEPQGDIVLKYRKLKGIKISKKDFYLMIDEIPLIAVIALTAKGKTTIPLYSSLKNKESDRVKSIIFLLKNIGADFSLADNKLTIKGEKELEGGFSSNFFKDHRIAMSATVASLVCKKPIKILEKRSIKKSYPDFWKDMENFKKYIHGY